MQAEKNKKKRSDQNAADGVVFADTSSPRRSHTHGSHSNNHDGHSLHSGPGVPADGGHSDGGHGHSCGGHSWAVMAAADIRDDFNQTDVLGEQVSRTETTMNVQEQFGQIDIYVFDQILRGNITSGMRVLDAGCGYGRNLVHLLREGCEVFAVDADAEGVEHVRALAAQLAPDLAPTNFRVGQLDQIDFPDNFADVVICNSVLHFARDDAHFLAIVAELWRVLRPGGLLFCRLGSRIGMQFERLRGNIFRINDGSEWFLVDEAMLMRLTDQLNAVMVDPLKTTIVQDYRCMTTWVLRKRRTGSGGRAGV